MKLRPLTTLLLMLSATFSAMTAFAEDQSSTERLEASESIIYDLGSNLAIVFFYTDSKGDRLLVTTIGPKDPDSGEAATQQIVEMDSDDKYVINIGSSRNGIRGSEPMKLSAHFEGKDLVVALNKV